VREHALKALEQTTLSNEDIYRALDFLDEFDLDEDMQNSKY